MGLSEEYEPYSIRKDEIGLSVKNEAKDSCTLR